MAVALTTADLEAAAGISSATAVRLLPVATALVEDYAPAAPTALQNEAVVRVAGYLAQTPASTLRRVDVGSVTIDYRAGEKTALRNSGAMALLTSFKRRRAGAVG